MKILVLNGEKFTESVRRLDEIVKKCRSGNWEIVKVEASDLLGVKNALINSPLFSGKKLIVITGAEKLTKGAVDLLNNYSERVDDYILLYSEKELGKSFEKSLPKGTKVETYKPSKYIWSFLEAFFPGNAKMAIFLLGKTLKTEAPEMVLALLARHLSNLYLIKTGGVDSKTPEWKRSKQASQAKHFTLEGLRDVIEELAKLDYESKTGKGLLSESLDILTLTYLK